MNLVISFSGRDGENCDQILDYIAKPEDTKKYFRNLNIHSCSHCQYECFTEECKYHDTLFLTSGVRIFLCEMKKNMGILLVGCILLGCTGIRSIRRILFLVLKNGLRNPVKKIMF